MPLYKPVLEKYVNDNFVETGTYHGEAVELALSLGFNNVYTVDVNPDFIKAVKATYAKDKRVTVNQGSSPDFLAKILPQVKGTITFWLDAHPLITPMTLFGAEFPLIRELLVLQSTLGSGKHVILIDDLRTFSNEESEILKLVVRQIWPAATISLENGIATDDVLCCRL